METGLGRGGVLPEAVAAAIAVVRASPGVRLGGVWTHLAAADDAANARGQDERFTAALGLVDAVAWGGGPEAVRRHLAGSGGVLGAQVARWDSVRTGHRRLRPGAGRARPAAGDDGRPWGACAPS